MLANVLSFVFGVVVTLTGLTLLSQFLLKKRSQALAPTEYEAVSQTSSPPPVEQPTTKLSVKDRLKKAVDITAKQSLLDARKGPEFVMQFNELELEKLSVLKTILADGFDPLIVIRYNTGDQEMLLSSYVQTITKGLA
jgi:hypothetical protein